MKITLSTFKEIFRWIGKNKALTIFIIASIFSAIAISFIDKKPIDTIKEQEQIILKDKDDRIKELESDIQELQTENEESNKRYIKIKDELTKLKNKKDSIQKPKTDQETKDRFKELGYETK